MGASPIHWVSFLGYPTLDIGVMVNDENRKKCCQINMISWITQETNPVYWAYTHCLTLEPWTVIISTFILVEQFDNTIRFATLESVRPGLTAKGSFKKGKSPELQRAILSLSLVSLKPECLTSRKKNPFSPAWNFFLLPLTFFSCLNFFLLALRLAGNPDRLGLG